MVKNTTGEPVSVDALTPTHSHTHTTHTTHTQESTHVHSAMELCWKHTGLPRNRGLESAGKQEE